MSKSKRCIVSLLALVLCLAIATVFVFAFAGCEEESASGEIVNDGDEYTLRDNEREKIKISEEPDENGIEQWEYFYLYCYTCTDPFACQGHYRYKRTSTGFVYDFYPYAIPMTLTDESGDESINSEIQIFLIFDEEPVIYDDGEDIYFYARPFALEIISLTGESLDSSNYAMYETAGYMYMNNSGSVNKLQYAGTYDDSNGNYEPDDDEDVEPTIDINGDNVAYGSGFVEGVDIYLQEYDISSDTAKSYTPFKYLANALYMDGSYTFYFYADDGELYTFDFYTIVDSYVWAALVEGTVELR